MMGLHSMWAKRWVLLGTTALLAACGGRNSSSDSSSTTSPSSSAQPAPVVLPTTTVSGIFDGSFTDTAQPVTALLQADGSYYMVYSNTSGTPTGAIVGSGTLTNGSFTSSNAADLSLVGTGTETPATATLSASLVQDKSFNGTLTYPAPKGAVAFSTTFNNSYTQLPALTTLAGTYTGAIATQTVKEDQLQLTITSSGAVSGKLSCGCNISATLTPRTDGSSYIISLSFVGGDHVLSNKSMSGNVYYDTEKKRIYIVGSVNGTDPAAFVGAKQ
jgi:hypothetical protein